jgi:hypothetical protein
MNEETVITLPRLIGTRDIAIEMTASVPSDDKPDHVVIIDARATVTAAPGFVDELVRQALQLRGPRALVIVGADQQLRRAFEEAARRRNVFDPLRFESKLPQPLAGAPRSWPAFTHVFEREGKVDYRPIGPERFVLHHGFGEPLVAVNLVEDVHGEYMGWIATGRTEPNMIQVRLLFRMQFPYGADKEVEAGKGEAVPLRIEVTA